MSSKLLYDKVIYCIVFVVVELSLIPTYGQQAVSYTHLTLPTKLEV